MNIYVGNLDYKISDTELGYMFEEFGTVSSSKIIMDKFSGRSKGFGFVTMENNDEAKNAIDKLNGKSLKDRTIVVNEAKPRRNDNSRY